MCEARQYNQRYMYIFQKSREMVKPRYNPTYLQSINAHAARDFIEYAIRAPGVGVQHGI